MKKRAALLGTGLAAGAICAAMAMNVFAAQITADRAKEIALENAGVKEDQVAYIGAELDYDDGKQVYDVEFFTADYKEYDYEINATTGEVISMDYDAERFRQREETKTGNKTAETAAQSGLTVDEVKAEALKIAGLADSQVTWGRISQDYDDGRMVYEGKFVFETSEYEFELDANTGNVIDWDVESIYD